jgi:uncharacterized protein (DUF58 family)
MSPRRRARPTREGWYYMAVLAFISGGAVLRSINLLVILAGMLIAPLLINWRLVIASLTGLSVRRRLPSQAVAGAPLTVDITIENPRWWMSSWMLRVEDWVEGGFRVHDPGFRAEGRESGGREKGFRSRWRWLSSDKTRTEAFLSHVPARGKATGTYRLTLHRRGRYRFGPLRISTRFPLGLVWGRMTLPEDGELVVAPRIGRLLPGWAELLEAELVGDQRRHPQRGVAEGDYYGLRPWQSGDSMRWVHWRTTARLGRPIVRQFERRRTPDVAIVLDPWLPPRPTERDEGLLELAISVAATAVADIAARGHSRLTFAVAGPQPHCWSGPASALFCQEVLDQLAELAPRGTGLAEALSRALEEAPTGARLIVISSRPADDPSLAGASAELPIDPAQVAWLDASSPELGELFVLE